MWDPYAEFETATLPNGLTAYAAHWADRPWEVIGFLIHTGARHDPEKLKGLAHFAEHMVSQNAIVPEKDIRVFFQGCGGEVDFGSTGFPETHYQFFVPTKKDVLEKALDIFGHMLLLARLENFMQREQEVIVGEFHSHYPKKRDLTLAIRERKTVYQGHWLEGFVRPLGMPESILSIQQCDLQRHYDAHYTPTNMSVVGVGGMDITELVKMLSESPFGLAKQGARMPLPKAIHTFTPLSENRYVSRRSRSNTAEKPSKVCDYRSVGKLPGTANEQSIMLLVRMLNRLLYEQVRQQRAWAYSAGCSTNNFGGLYQFSIDCDALKLDAVNDIEAVINYCIESLQERQDLFLEIQGETLAQVFMLDFSAHGILRVVLNDLAKHQRIISLSEYQKDIEKTTFADMRNFVDMLKPEKRWTLIRYP